MDDILTNINTSKFSEIRELLYDIFIYELDLTECVFYIINELIKKKHIKNKKRNRKTKAMREGFHWGYI